MPVDRTTILRGPCKLTYEGATFYSKGGVTLNIPEFSFIKETDAYGPVGRSITDKQVTVEFEPCGELESLTVLFPYASSTMGTDIYGATDKPLVIVSVDATYTILNAAITQMPGIRATVTNTAFGQIQFTGLVSNEGDPTDLDSYFTVGAGASIGSGFNPALVLCGPYEATLALLNAENGFPTESGFEVSFDLSLSPIVVDGYGTVGMTLTSLGATATFTPIIDQEGLANAFNQGAFIGDEYPVGSLEITPGFANGLGISFPNAQVTSGALRWNPAENRVGQVTVAAKRGFTTGTPNALFAVTIPT